MLVPHITSNRHRVYPIYRMNTDTDGKKEEAFTLLPTQQVHLIKHIGHEPTCVVTDKPRHDNQNKHSHLNQRLGKHTKTYESNELPRTFDGIMHPTIETLGDIDAETNQPLLIDLHIECKESKHHHHHHQQQQQQQQSLSHRNKTSINQ